MTDFQSSARSSSKPSPALVADDAWVRQYRIDKPERYFPKVPEPVIWGYVSPVASEVTVGNRHHSARPYAVGDLRLVRPNTAIRRVPEKPAAMCALHLPVKTFYTYLGAPERQLDPTLERLEQETFRSPMIEMLAERLLHAEKLQAPSLLKNSLAESVVFELWRMTGQADPATTAPRSMDAATLDKINQFIEAEIDDKLDVHALAQVAGMSVSAFTRSFKQSTGKTPYQHVMSFRLAKARELITGSRLSLAQIAYACGFSSQSHMTEVFSAKVGVSPGRLRRDMS